MLTPIFRGEGTTPGERELAKLVDLSFFGLWSYPSVYREYTKGGRTLRHEVADLFVLFGKDVVIFSEKDIKFPDGDDLAIAWGRWFSQSVSKSIGQLRGAERHVKLGSNALFLDAKCTQPFPFALDTPDLRIHLVAICRNSSSRAKEHFAQFVEEGSLISSGTLMFIAQCREEQMRSTPFCIGDFHPQKTFVHVFYEESFNLLITELDAGPDFIDYLRVRERAVRKERLSIFHGEEDFLAVYLNNIGENGFGAIRPDRPLPSCSNDALLTIEEGMWPLFKKTSSYALHAAQREDASFWKRLTNDFSQAILTATVGEAQNESLATHELAVRAMASENRLSRAALGHSLMEKFNAVPTNSRSARVVPSLSNPGRLYIFLLFPRVEAHGTYEGYRKERRACMELYARVARLKFPEHPEIVIFGADTKGSVGSSETVLFVEGNRDMSDEERAETQALMNEYRILTDMSQARPFTYKPSVPSLNISDAAFPLIPRRLPSVNEPCYCGSGRKYKKCCRP